MWMLVLLPLLAVLVAPFVKWFYVLYKFRSLNKLPGPKRIPLIGYPFKLNPKGLMEDIEDLYSKYNSRFAVYTGTQVRVFHRKPEHLQFMLTSNHITKSDGYHLLSDWIGDGLINSTGDKWRTRRRLIEPSFHFSILEQFMQTYNTIGDKLTAVLGKDLGKPIDVAIIIEFYSFDVICETAMGMVMNSLESDDRGYVENVRKYNEIVAKRFFSFWEWNDLLFKIFSQLYKQHVRLVHLLHSVTEMVIKERQKYFAIPKEEREQDSGKKFGIKRKVALMDTMLTSADENKLSISSIREEIDTFLAAGYDTVGAAMIFTLYCLSCHPDVQQKVYEEIVSIIGEKNGQITVAHLQKLTYLDMVIKESLRLYTPIPFTEREVDEEFVLDGVTYPTGTIFTTGLSWVHRNPEIYTDPEKFDPDRFLPENQAKRHPYSFIPFSSGPRKCIGQKYAQLLMKTTMVKVLQQYELLPDPSFKMEIGWLIVLKPINGCYIILKKRHHNA